MKRLFITLTLFISATSFGQTKEETIDWMNSYGKALLTKDFYLPNFDYDVNKANRYSFINYEVVFSESEMSLIFNYEYDNSKVWNKPPNSKDYGKCSFKYEDIHLSDQDFLIKEAQEIPEYAYPIPTAWANKKLRPKNTFYQMEINMKKYNQSRKTFSDIETFEWKDEILIIVSMHKENLQRFGKAILNLAKLNGAKKRISENTF